MTTQKAFATCNGSITTLTNIGYVPESRLASHYGLTAGTMTVKYASACGGGMVTQWDIMIGRCPSCGQQHVAERLINRPSNASNHKCGGKCRSAKGPNCECSCKGAQHGAG